MTPLARSPKTAVDAKGARLPPVLTEDVIVRSSEWGVSGLLGFIRVQCGLFKFIRVYSGLFGFYAVYSSSFGFTRVYLHLTCDWWEEYSSTFTGSPSTALNSRYSRCVDSTLACEKKMTKNSSSSATALHDQPFAASACHVA
eukprot:4424537-Pyramimonas_sp.AAC.1